ncbi:MAG: prepilin peptidase, partial [Shewanella sp.]
MTESISLFGAALEQSPWLFVVLSFVFAATIGSFLNVVIHRTPVMMKREWQQECNQYLTEYHPKVVAQVGIDTLNQPLDSYPTRYTLVAPGSACPKCHSAIKPWHNLPIVGWLMLRGKCAACAAPISAR